MELTYEDEMLITSYCNWGTRKDVIAAIEQRRSWLKPDEDMLTKMCGAVLDKLNQMTDEEFNALNLFSNMEGELAFKAAYASADTLKCPHCGEMLLLGLMKSKHYHISADGRHLVRDFSKTGADKVQTFLFCWGCGKNYSPERNEQGVIKKLKEMPDRWS